MADAPTPETETARAARLEWLYRGAAIALCHERGIDPFAVVLGSGSPAWHLVGYEAACIEDPEGRR